MMRNSSHTGRAPRNMQSAFGPYTSRDLHGGEPPRRTVLQAVGDAVCWILALALIALMFTSAGWF